MTFVSTQPVRFAHVDAAGIVFYPRYFEMLNVAVEDYFAQTVGIDFAAMHVQRKIGVPTVSLSSDFVRPSRLGDMLQFRLTISAVGRSSVDIDIDVQSSGESRWRGHAVLVCIDLANGQAREWPNDIRPLATAGATTPCPITAPDRLPASAILSTPSG